MARTVINPTRAFTRLVHTDGSAIVFEATRIEYDTAHYPTVTQAATVEEFLAEPRSRTVRALSLTTEARLEADRVARETQEREDSERTRLTSTSTGTRVR